MKWNGTQRTAVNAVALLAAISAASITAAHAQQTNQRQFTFNIPAKSVPQAVNDIGRISGLSVVFPENKPITSKGKPVNGSMTADQALSTLLAGTGLSYRLATPHSHDHRLERWGSGRRGASRRDRARYH